MLVQTKLTVNTFPLTVVVLACQIEYKVCFFVLWSPQDNVTELLHKPNTLTAENSTLHGHILGCIIAVVSKAAQQEGKVRFCPEVKISCRSRL